MDNLNECRIKIDEIDKKLMALFEERMNVVVNVAKYKQKNNLPIFHKDRENEVIKKNVGRIEQEDLKPYADKLLHYMMDLSKDYQCEKIGKREAALSKGREVKIAFQGVEGSFGEEALIKYFGESYERKNYEDFEDVFKALKDEEVTYGVLPIENSSTGSITTVYDLLKQYDFHIVGETILRIEQNLLAIKGAKIDDIKEVYSHSQGIEQSSEYLKTLGDIKKIPYINTAISAKFVSDSKDKSKAAIASIKAAETYDLEILKRNINNAKENYTRFIIIGKNLETTELCNKLTISFTLENKAGNLYKELKAFYDNDINMRKIESRPMGNGSFNYFFYADIDGNLEHENIKNALNEIRKSTYEFKILGAYKREE